MRNITTRLEVLEARHETKGSSAEVSEAAFKRIAADLDRLATIKAGGGNIDNDPSWIFLQQQLEAERAHR